MSPPRDPDTGLWASIGLRRPGSPPHWGVQLSAQYRARWLLVACPDPARPRYALVPGGKNFELREGGPPAHQVAEQLTPLVRHLVDVSAASRRVAERSEPRLRS